MIGQVAVRRAAPSLFGEMIVRVEGRGDDKVVVSGGPPAAHPYAAYGPVGLHALRERAAEAGLAGLSLAWVGGRFHAVDTSERALEEAARAVVLAIREARGQDVARPARLRFGPYVGTPPLGWR